MQNTPQNFHQADQTNPIDVHLPDTPLEMVLASPWARMRACLINIMLNIILIIAPIMLLVLSHTNDSIWSSIICAGLTLYLTFIIWQIIWMSRHGQSIGKYLNGIKVVDIHGKNPGFIGTVLLREVFFYIIIFSIGFIVQTIGITFGFWKHNLDGLNILSNYDLTSRLNYIPIIICTIMLFRISTQRRTLQDYLAKTIVIKA